MEDTLRILGRRIADLRNKNNLTQEKLAEITGYTTNHIAKLESARTKPSFELLVSISKAFNIEIKELFNFDEYQQAKYIQFEFNRKLKNLDIKKLKLLYKIMMSILS